MVIEIVKATKIGRRTWKKGQIVEVLKTLGNQLIDEKKAKLFYEPPVMVKSLKTKLKENSNIVSPDKDTEE